MCAFHEEALQVKHIQEDYSSESAAGRVYEQVAICSNRLSVTGTMLHLCARVFFIRIERMQVPALYIVARVRKNEWK